MSSSPDPGLLKQHPPKSKTTLYIAAAAVSILALALGLGLGLGLKHHSAVASTTTTPTPSPTVQFQDSSAFFLNTSLSDDPPTTRVFNFTLDERTGAPDGVQKPMLVVNGIFPGPTIEVNEGDQVIINVTNNMANATAIHWHGLYQRGTNYYDGTSGITQCGIPPGQSMLYNFSTAGWVGSTWWHAHYDTQYTDGLTGALIVHSKNESVPAYDGDILLEVSDLYHQFSPLELAAYFQPGGIQGTPGNEPVPDGATINGIGQYNAWNNETFFNITLEANKTYRLRVVNTGSFVGMHVSIDSHVLSVIEADGTAVTPVPATSVFPSIAQRYSVLFTTNQTAGAYWIRAALDQDAFTYTNPGTQTEIRGIIRYGVPNTTLPSLSLLNTPPSPPSSSFGELDESDLVPVGGGPAPNATLQIYFTIAMEYPGGQDYFSQFLAFINTTSWSPLTNTSTLFSGLGDSLQDTSATFNNSQLIETIAEEQIVQVVVDNLDDGDHPLHLHGHKFWVMANGPGRYQGNLLNNSIPNTEPMLRDTFVFPAYTHTIVRFKADNPGFWAMHCHIAWHMAAGLLFQFNALPSESAKFDIPQYMIDQCSAQPSSSS